VPNWRRFLRDLLKDQADERTVRLIPVALVILRQYGDSNRTAETGWLDLAEWAMLAHGRYKQTTTNKFVKAAIYEMWVKFYLAEVEDTIVRMQRNSRRTQPGAWRCRKLPRPVMPRFWRSGISGASAC